MEPKKSLHADLEKSKALFFQIGLVISLSLVYIAFEWKSGSINDFSMGQLQFEDVPEEIIPITRQEEQLPPPPPPLKQFVIVQDDSKIENEAQVQDTEINQETIIEVEEIRNEVIEEPEVFLVVEEMPGFPGGESQLYSFLAKNIRYPSLALELGVEGMVFISFVIDVDGAVKKAKVIKGIGGGCDEEAVRVIQTLPKWNPGKQRGKPVPVQYSMPVRFQLK